MLPVCLYSVLETCNTHSVVPFGNATKGLILRLALVVLSENLLKAESPMLLRCPSVTSFTSPLTLACISLRQKGYSLIGLLLMGKQHYPQQACSSILQCTYLCFTETQRPKQATLIGTSRESHAY